MQPGGGGRAAIAAESLDTAPCYRRNGAAGYLANERVTVRHIEVAGGVGRYTSIWKRQLRDSGDYPVRNLSNARIRISSVNDVEVSQGIDGDVGREPQLGAYGGSVIATRSGCSDSRHGGNQPTRNPPDTMVSSVRQVNIVALATQLLFQL